MDGRSDVEVREASATRPRPWMKVGGGGDQPAKPEVVIVLATAR